MYDNKFKTERLMSLIGILVLSLLIFLSTLMLIMSIFGLGEADFTTMVNGEVVVHSEATTRYILTIIFSSILGVSIVAIIFGIIGFVKIGKSNKASAILHILGAIISMNLLVLISWLISSVMLLKKKGQYYHET